MTGSTRNRRRLEEVELQFSNVPAPAAFTREDFEHAARAAGLEGYSWCDENHCMVKPAGYPADGPFADGVYIWDPSYEFGVALQLAAKLRLHILHNDPGDAVLWVSAVLDRRGLHGVAEFKEESERVEATCIAIFRAAVAIGKALHG